MTRYSLNFSVTRSLKTDNFQGLGSLQVYSLIIAKYRIASLLACTFKNKHSASLGVQDSHTQVISQDSHIRIWVVRALLKSLKFWLVPLYRGTIMKGEAKTSTRPRILAMKSRYRELHRITLFWSTFFFWETTGEEKIVISKYDLKKKKLEKLTLHCWKDGGRGKENIVKKSRKSPLLPSPSAILPLS